MKKIKIMRIFSRLNIGGPSIHAILLTAGLNDDQFESILVKGKEDLYEGNMLYMAKEKGIKPIVIKEIGRKISLWDDIKAFFKIFHLIKKERPHIVDTHTAKAGALGRGAAILYNIFVICGLKIKKINFLRFLNSNYQSSITNFPIKLVHTFHGHVFNNYFGAFKTNLFIWIERFLGLFTDKIITVSKRQRKEIIGFRIGNNKKIVSIPYGLELKKFLDIDRYKGQLRKELGISSKTKLVGIIARLVPVKNHKMFINLVANLKLRNKKLNAKFLIVGDGELRKQLENFVKKKELEKDIIFLGFRKDMKRIYADLDLVVLTSLNEGSPIALIEAMAAGKPVISTDVGGASDLLESREYKKKSSNYEIICKKQMYRVTRCGVLVDSNNIKSLVLVIEDLLENNILRKKMGNAGRKIVYPKYDISRLINDMRIFYINLIGEIKLKI